ncbi:unnamed protein product [Ilex paraguariensis]|uniref:Uncharacterized protein n=1 Tax=Ilex paraguariensis TaxID=185542 RepID=A0ABC8UFS9_9AQUA
MEVDTETSPSYLDPEDLDIRERFRRYGKRQSASRLSPLQENSASKFSEIRSNAALFLEDIKQEVESLDADCPGGTPAKAQSAVRRRSSVGIRGISDADVGADSICRAEGYPLKACKHEDDMSVDSGDTTFTLFASLLDSALQGA